MTNTVVNTRLVPTAAALIGVVYDHGPDAVSAVLRRIPDTSRDELLVLLAAMVDPDKAPSELLAWTTAGPVKSRDNGPEPAKAKKKSSSQAFPREHGSERGYRQHRSRADMPACTSCHAAHRAWKAGQKERYQKARESAASTLGKVL